MSYNQQHNEGEQVQANQEAQEGEQMQIIAQNPEVMDEGNIKKINSPGYQSSFTQKSDIFSIKKKCVTSRC